MPGLSCRTANAFARTSTTVSWRYGIWLRRRNSGANRSSLSRDFQESRRDPIISQISRGIAISSESDFSRCVLPDGILPGTYRVIDERGSVGWTTIQSGDGSQEDASRADQESQKSADLFVSQSPKGRWYFIRIEAAPSLATPQVDHPVLR